MKPSIAQLFLEAFASPWPECDPEYMEEIKMYENYIRRLISVDNNLSHYIQMQPVMSFDQLSKTPVITDTHKSQITIGIKPAEGHFSVTIHSVSCPLSSLFSEIRIEYGNKVALYACSSSTDELISSTFPGMLRGPVKVTAIWSHPLLKMSPALQSVVAAPYASKAEISLKLFSLIDSKNLYQNGIIKCDSMPLKNLTMKESIPIDELHTIIDSHTEPFDPFVAVLTDSQVQKSYLVQCPQTGDMDKGHFSSVPIEETPIRELLMAVIKSKEQLTAIQNFKKHPEAFVKQQVLLAARNEEIPEMYNTDYYYQQSWVTDRAADYLKQQRRRNRQ